MLKSKRMLKLTIFGPKRYMKEVIEELYEMDVVHIEDHTKDRDEEDVFDIGEPLDVNEENSDLLVRIRSLISTLKIDSKRVEKEKGTITSIEKDVDKIQTKVSDFVKKRDYYQGVKEIYEKNRIKKSLRALSLDSEEDLSKYKYYIGFVNFDPVILKNEIEHWTSDFVLKYDRYQDIYMIALFLGNKEKRVEKILDEHDFSPIDRPVIKDHFDLKAKPGQKFVKLNHEEKVVQGKLEKVNEKLDEIKEKEDEFLLRAEKRMKQEVEKGESPLRFGTTDNTFLLKGWVPKNEKKVLKKRIKGKTNNKVMVNFEKPGKHDKVPVKFKNPKIVRPFESFMELYTLPSYQEIDPTFLMSLTFPIFFGFMLGDVGYGLITLILFLILKAKMPSAKNMLNAFIIASIATIVFGVVFGEYFGVETLPPEWGQRLGIQPHELHGETIYQIPNLFTRSHQISDLLSLSILIGVVHLFIGLVVGFINVYQHHGLKEAILEKLGWIMIMPLMVWILLNPLTIIQGFVADMLNAIMPGIPVVAGLFGIGAVLTIIGEGVIGVIEILFMQLMSNILSYARLMAVGLASLSLAAVVNDLAGDMIAGMGLVGLIPATIILLLGHGINIALGVLSPFLHSIRLHYVEFFGKFYQGGGKRFESFGNTE